MKWLRKVARIGTYEKYLLTNVSRNLVTWKPWYRKQREVTECGLICVAQGRVQWWTFVSIAKNLTAAWGVLLLVQRLLNSQK
jgi:hypothetical protein